jgi:hypothetical protein
MSKWIKTLLLTECWKGYLLLVCLFFLTCLFKNKPARGSLATEAEKSAWSLVFKAFILELLVRRLLAWLRSDCSFLALTRVLGSDSFRFLEGLMLILLSDALELELAMACCSLPINSSDFT